MQARDELNVEFRLLPHWAWLAFQGALQASPQGPGGRSPGWGSVLGGSLVLVTEGTVLRAGNTGVPNPCTSFRKKENPKSYLSQKNKT